ncbi:proline racemase family protein [Salinicoccus sp. Marseille-QA3877]
MIFNKTLNVIDTHTFGEPTRIVNGGLFKVEGKTVAEQRDYIAENYDWLRGALIQEPRGHRDMFGAILLPPLSDDVDFGVVFMDNGNFLNMCGHATIGISMAIVETGMVEADGPEVKLVLETPAGKVYPTVKMTAGKVDSVTFQNVPAYLEARDFKVTIPDYGEINTDISFGGNYFAWVDADKIGLKIDKMNTKEIKRVAALIKKEVNENYKVQHPTNDYINYIDIVTFFSKPTLEEADYKNVHIFSDNQADRSPGGTGTTAMVARMVGRDELKLNEGIVCEGFVGGTFKGVATEEVKLGDKNGVITEITGKAFISAISNIFIDPDDPFKYGFIVE